MLVIKNVGRMGDGRISLELGVFDEPSGEYVEEDAILLTPEQAGQLRNMIELQLEGRGFTFDDWAIGIPAWAKGLKC